MSMALQLLYFSALFHRSFFFSVTLCSSFLFFFHVAAPLFLASLQALCLSFVLSSFFHYFPHFSSLSFSVFPCLFFPVSVPPTMHVFSREKSRSVGRHAVFMGSKSNREESEENHGEGGEMGN